MSIEQLMEALRIAHGHIDMGALEISHCKDAELIRAALSQQPATGEPVLFIHPDTFAMNSAQVGAWRPGYELTSYIPLYTHPAPSDDVVRDAERYRWLAGYCRSTSEHWGGRWSIIIDGPAPKTHDSEDDLDAAIDAAMQAAK